MGGDDKQHVYKPAGNNPGSLAPAEAAVGLLLLCKAAGQVFVDDAGQQCLIGYSLFPGPRVCEIEVALGHPEIHPPGLVERIASRLSGQLGLALGIRGGAQLVPLESIEHVAFFSVQFVVHGVRLLLKSLVAFRLGMIVFRKRVPSVCVTKGTR